MICQLTDLLTSAEVNTNYVIWVGVCGRQCGETTRRFSFKVVERMKFVDEIPLELSASERRPLLVFRLVPRTHTEETVVFKESTKDDESSGEKEEGKFRGFFSVTDESVTSRAGRCTWSAARCNESADTLPKAPAPRVAVHPAGAAPRRGAG